MNWHAHRHLIGVAVQHALFAVDFRRVAVVFTGFVDGTEVEIRHHADAVIPRTNQRIQHVRHAGAGFVLNIFEDLIAFTGCGRNRLACANAVGQQISRLIDDADFAGL